MNCGSGSSRVAFRLLGGLVTALMVVIPLSALPVGAASAGPAGRTSASRTPASRTPVTTSSTTTTTVPARHAAPARPQTAPKARVTHPTIPVRGTDRDVVSAVTASVAASRGQSIDGFGASGAWWPTDVSKFSPDAQRRLGALLFSKTGLDLSQYRYNIGGGGAGVTNPYKAPPTFLKPSGRYDWNADPAGVAFLKLAAQYHVPDLIGFVNSAPPAFTTNGKSCGGELESTKVAAFAAYLSAVVAHLSQEVHQDLTYVSPMNEPDTAQAACHQEGMVVPVNERADLVMDLAADLAAGSDHARVIADESSLVTQLMAEAPQWLPAAGSSVAVLAHHAYDYPDAATLAKVAQFRIKHWSSEICCFNGRGFGWQYDPAMASGLWLADTIWADLTEARDSAFDWWVAASPNLGCDPVQAPGCDTQVNPGGRNDGLVYFDPYWYLDGNQTFYLTKRYWVLAAFSRYVRPGAVLHQMSGLPDGLKGVAFQDRSGWVIELINDSQDQPYGVHVRLPYSAGQTVHAYVTDATHDLSTTGISGSGLGPVVQAAPGSLTTIVDGPAAVRTHRARPRVVRRT